MAEVLVEHVCSASEDLHYMAWLFFKRDWDLKETESEEDWRANWLDKNLKSFIRKKNH